VEDDECISEPLVRVLRAEGFDVTHLAEGSVALEHVERTAPDLVLLDLTLPDGDGLAVLAAAATTATARGTVFVALTGRDDPATRERCLAAGCADVLVKPVPARELVARSRALLARDSAGARPA